MLRLLRPSRSLQFRFFSRWASSITTHLHGTELSCMLSALQTKKANKNRFIDLDCAPKKGYHLASYIKRRDFHHKAKHYVIYIFIPIIISYVVIIASNLYNPLNGWPWEKKECYTISNVGWQKKVEKLVTGNMMRKWMDLQRVKLCSISFYKITKIESLFLLVKNLWFIVPVNS